MEDDEKEPQGELTVKCQLNLPTEGSTLYSKLSHGFVRTRVFVLSLSCTQSEAEQLVARIRDENPGINFPAEWKGANEL